MLAFETNAPSPEERIAKLTDIAYQSVLENGFRGSFLDLELSLWRAIRQAARADGKEREAAGPRES
jgi:hypothetical protein